VNFDVDRNSHIENSEYEAKYIQDVSIEHRKAFAQFFTPRSIAEFMAGWIQGGKELNTVLYPSFGLGIFARTIRKTNKNCAIKGFDIDENILQRAAGIFRKDAKTFVILQDYMLNDWENRYDGIICNPPYFKFHDYDNKTVINEMAKNLGLKLSGFTNLYALLLLKSLHQLNDGGDGIYRSFRIFKCRLWKISETPFNRKQIIALRHCF